MPQQTPDWIAFGKLLLHHRVNSLNHFDRREFSEERGIAYATAYRIETGKMRRPEEATKAAIEGAYGLAQGSFDRSAAAGELELAGDAQTETPAASSAPADPNRAYVLAADPQLGPAQWQVLAGIVRSWIEPSAPAADQRRIA